MSSSAPFDPYQQWLGIEPHEQPADHYRLLGLARFENDLQKIAAVADQQMATVRSFQTGPRGAYTQKLLNDLAAARVCLLNPETKRQYDEQLADRLMQVEAQRRAAAVMSLSPPPPAEEVFVASAPFPVARQSRWQLMLLGCAAMLAVALAVGGWAISGWLAHRAPHEQEPTSHLSAKKPKAEPDTKSQPPIVQLQGDRAVELPLGAAVLSGDVVLETLNAEAAIVQWASTDDEARWRFRLPRPGFFAVELTYSTSVEATEPEIELRLNQRSKACSLRSSGGPQQLVTDSYTVAVPQSGTHQLSLRPRKLTLRDGLRLKTVRLIPVETEMRPPGPGEN